MRTSPTKGDWWDRFKEAVKSLPTGPVSLLQAGRSIPVDTPLIHHPDTIEQILADNTRLLMENQRMRQTLLDTREIRKQLRDAKHNESLMAARVEAFRKRWPAIHKQFFATERKGK